MSTAPGPRVVSGLGGPAPDRSARHRLPVLRLDSDTYAHTQDCVQCGLCLPKCPTYQQTGLEADSPRGRIRLIKGLADGLIDASESVTDHLDLCLDCRACETACPSSVVYHELIEQTRQRLTSRGRGASTDRLLHTVIRQVFTRPTLLQAAVWPARLLQAVGLWDALAGSRLVGALTPALLNMVRLLPPSEGKLWESRLNCKYPARTRSGQPSATAGFFAGCVGGALFQPVNRQSIDLLTHCGCETVVPRRQVCCGAIHHHSGDVETARRLARQNIDAFERSAAGERFDWIVSSVAGCGAMLREYPHLLRDDPDYANRAHAFAERCRDISQTLVELGVPTPRHDVTMRVTVHDACHLAHAQRAADAPRQLLAMIPGLDVRPLAESDTCCGAAGTYNLTQPEMAQRLGEQKADHIGRTGAGVCVTGNAGCAMHIDASVRRMGLATRSVHPVTLLHRACFGPLGSTDDG